MRRAGTCAGKTSNPSGLAVMADWLRSPESFDLPSTTGSVPRKRRSEGVEVEELERVELEGLRIDEPASRAPDHEVQRRRLVALRHPHPEDLARRGKPGIDR